MPKAIQPTRILLVDDEPGVRGYMKIILQKYGWSVTEAEDGVDACRIIDEQKGNFDLLVTDIRMPGMDGFALAEHVKETFPALRVLFVSGYAADAPPIPVGGLLKKPFPPQELVTRVRALTPA